MIIIEKYFDDAGKYRVVVEIDNTRAIPLKFQQEVDDEMAFLEVQKILDTKKKQQEQQDYLSSLLEEERKLLEELNNGNY